MTYRFAVLAILFAVVQLGGCGDRGAAPAGAAGDKAASRPAGPVLNKLSRADLNRRAAELFLPLFWRSDANSNKAIDPDELVALWGIAGGGQLGDYVDTTVPGGGFTEKFLEAYRRMTTRPDFSKLSPAEQKRRQAVLEELAQGRPTLVETDLRNISAEDKAVVENILAAAQLVERIYARQMGVPDPAATVAAADDPASAMLMYRNQGPFCEAPRTEANPDCHALAERPARISGLYPAGIQNGTDTRFCTVLEGRPDADELFDPFSVVIAKAGGKSAGDAASDDLDAVPYSAAYRAEMEQVSSRLMAASAAIQDPGEGPMKLYLAVAAESFLSNDWQPADEAWARMTATNSKWYLRIGPDEVYSEPCSRKAMFHAAFARINPDGLEWQRKLEPRQANMEAALAKLAGPPYTARPVTFHLPDFLDIVLNAGDSRQGLGGFVGQSLPNWGPVVEEGRGRTVAMVNLYTDEDSQAAWRNTASSLFCPKTMERAAFEPKLTVMSTVLHEAAHNLGPSHEYQVQGKDDAAIFGGPLASMLEELKAQTAALYFTDWLVTQGVIDQVAADKAHLGDVAWAFGHIAEGMRDSTGKSKPYSQLASIQMGSLFKDGVLTWQAKTRAASKRDQGCFDVDLARWPAAIGKLAERVLRIKGTGDRKDAEVLVAELVNAGDDWASARNVIRERVLRAPAASFVYAIER